MLRPYIRNSYREGSRSWLTEKYFSMTNFAGGLNNVEPDNEIGDNESTDCKNMRFVDDTIMEKRHGIKEYDVSAYPSLTSSVTWLDVFNPTLSTSKIVRGTSTELYIGNTKICDVSGNVVGATYVGKYYFVDGHSLRVYDNNRCYRIIREPIEHINAAASKDAVTLTFDKLPEVVKVGDPVIILAASVGQTANFSTTVKSISGTTVTLNTALPAAIIKSTPVFFYTPKDSKNVVGEEVWDDVNLIAYYKPCEMEIADSYAGESYFPDSPSVLVVHNSRLFITGDSTQPHGVYMSRTAQPLYFPSNAGISVKPDGNKIIDLVVFDNALVIARHHDMYALYGSSEYQTSSSSPYYIKQLDVSCGVMSSNSGALLNNYYIYLGYDGRFYKLNAPSTYVEYLMTSPLAHKCDIYADPFTFPQNSVVEVNAVAYRNEIYFNINSNMIVVYNYDNMSFTYFVGWYDSTLCVYENKLLIGRTDGKLAVYCDDDDDVYDDMGLAIDACFSTKRFDFINPVTYKYFKQFMVTSYAFNNIKSYITVSLEVDFIDIVQPTAINSNLSRFDNANWNTDIFNNRNLYKSQFYKLDVRGRTIKFKFSNSNINESLRLYDVNVLYTMRDVR